MIDQHCSKSADDNIITLQRVSAFSVSATVDHSFYFSIRLSQGGHGLSLCHRDHSMPPPFIIFKVAIHVMAFADWFWRAVRPAPVAMVSMVSGLARGQILCTLTELQVADALAQGSKTAAELAAELGGALGLNH